MVYENVKRLCQESHISITDLEQKLGFGNGTIGKWKSNGSVPGIDKVSAIAKFFGVTVDSLLAKPRKSKRKEGAQCR